MKASSTGIIETSQFTIRLIPGQIFEGGVSKKVKPAGYPTAKKALTILGAQSSLLIYTRAVERERERGTRSARVGVYIRFRGSGDTGARVMNVCVVVLINISVRVDYRL